MNLELINISILFFGLFVGLWEIAVMARGKRILKGTSELVGLVNMGAFLHLTSQLTENTLFQMLAIPAGLFIYGLIRYHFGVEYKVHSQKPQLLDELIGVALRDIENIRPERVQEERKVIFTALDSKKVIELKEKDATWGEKKEYAINFKRWFNHESRNEILSLIENTLHEEEEYKHGKIKITLQAAVLVVLMGAVVFLASKMVMEPRDIRTVVSDELPVELYLIESDSFLRDEAVIKELHEDLKGSIAYLDNDITKKRALEISRATLSYASNERIVYMGRNGIYLFISDAETGNKSIFHRLCWKVHQLYDERDGTFYRIYANGNINGLLDRIMDSD